MRVAIPRMGDGVAPCLECAATITIFTVEEGQVVDRFDFPIRSREPLDRIRLLRDQQVDTIICGGVQDVFEDLLRASGIQMISWVTGNTDDLIGLFLKGRLAPGRQSDRSDSDHGPSNQSTKRKKDK